MGILEQEKLTQAEIDKINEIIDFIVNAKYLPTEDEIKSFILESFSENSVSILNSVGTPLNILLNAIARLGQMNAGIIKESVSKMLYTQASGDDLSLCAANYGYTRIEAKPSSLIIVLTADKKITINANTSFTDGIGTIWLTQQDTNLEENIPTRINLFSRDTGAINYISPISPTNTIAGLTSIEVDANSIIIGREQESDTELKETISRGISVFGSDNACERDLLQLRMVSSAFVKTNSGKDPITFLGATIDSRQRYIALRLSNPILSKEEADLISKTISDNTIYNANYQKPQDGFVKYFFGIKEEDLTKDEASGGAGLNGVSEDSNVVLVRQTTTYGNYIDIYFSLARATDVDVRLEIRYKSNYTNNEKENMVDNIKQIIAQAVSQLSQVGSSLLISQIIERVLTYTDLNDKITIRSSYLNLHNSTQITQSLDSKSDEYFRVYDIPTQPYAGVIITES